MFVFNENISLVYNTNNDCLILLLVMDVLLFYCGYNIIIVVQILCIVYRLHFNHVPDIIAYCTVLIHCHQIICVCILPK